MSADAAMQLAENIAMLRGLLANAAGRNQVVLRSSPDEPTAVWRSGFGAGLEAGWVSALTLALSVLSGESPIHIAREAEAQAEVDLALPFSVFVDDAADAA